MHSLMPISKIERVKINLGNIQFLDFRGLDLITAHHELGQEVRIQTQKILKKKLDLLKKDELIAQIKLVNQCKHTLEEKISSNIDYRIRNALRKYLACLSAWSIGARLNEFHHNSLREARLDNMPILPE